MNDRSKRLARMIGMTLRVARWVIITMLVLLVPALIFSVFSPDAVPMAAVTDGTGAAADLHSSFPAQSFLAYAIVNLALVLVVVSKLRHVMGTASAGTPFEGRNTSRLRGIAAAMAGLAILPTLVRPFVPLAARASVDMSHPNFNFGLWLAAVVVLVLAEVFREGARLREDADMTV